MRGLKIRSGVVLPGHDAILAMTCETTDMQAVLDAAWTHLLSAMRNGAVSPGAADMVLREWLAGLRLLFPAGDQVPDSEVAVARSALSLCTGSRRGGLGRGRVTLFEKDGAATTLPLVEATGRGADAWRRTGQGRRERGYRTPPVCAHAAQTAHHR